MYCIGHVKRKKEECANCGGISLLSIPGKIYRRGITERVMTSSEDRVANEQSSFSKRRRCIDKVSFH